MSEQSENMATDAGTDAVTLATELTIAWLSNPNTRAGAEEVPGFLRTMHEAVGALAAVQGASRRYRCASRWPAGMRSSA